MTVSTRPLAMLADALCHRRTQLRTRSRRLDAGRQALLVVAHLRKGETHANLACGFAIDTRSPIENQIHRGRDVTYDQDRSQIRTGPGPQVMAALGNAAIGALRAAGVTNIAAANCHHARDSTRPLALLGIT